MSQVMVRYRVKPDRVAENEELVRAVSGDRCDEGPVVTELREVGSFNLFGDVHDR